MCFTPLTQPELSKDIISLKSLIIIGIILNLLSFKHTQGKKKIALKQDDFVYDETAVSYDAYKALHRQTVILHSKINLSLFRKKVTLDFKEIYSKKCFLLGTKTYRHYMQEEISTTGGFEELNCLI